MRCRAIMPPQFNWPSQVVEHFESRGYQPDLEADNVAHTILTPEESKVSDETRNILYSTLPLRFWMRTEQTETCWLWTGWRHTGRTGMDYGMFKWQGRPRRVHCLIWELLHGVPPAKMVVCHKCDNPPCFNPSHLSIGTQADNLHDAMSKGRMYRTSKSGTRDSFLKLTHEQVYAIKLALAAGEFKKALARKYGVTKKTIQDIADGVSWRHVVIENEPQKITACWSSRTRARNGLPDIHIHLRRPNGNTACGRRTTAAWDYEEHEDGSNISCQGCRHAIESGR